MIRALLNWLRAWWSPPQESPRELLGPPRLADTRRIVCDRIRERVLSLPQQDQFSVPPDEYDSVVGLLSGNCKPSMATTLWTFHVPDNRKYVILRKAAV
jgi:hypothetical protein